MTSIVVREAFQVAGLGVLTVGQTHDIDASLAALMVNAGKARYSGADPNTRGLQPVFLDPVTGSVVDMGGNVVLISSSAAAVSNWGTRIWTLGSTATANPASFFLGGTFLDDGSDTGTEHWAIELGEFTAIQLIFQNNGRAPLIINGAKLFAAADFSDKVQDAGFAGSPVTGTFCGGASGTTVSPGLQSNLCLSDVIPISSIPRSDIAGALAAVFIRIKYAFPQGASSVMSCYDTSGADWSTGARQCWQAAAYGDKLTSALGRTPAAVGRRALVGIRYLSPYKVMTVAVSGTSLTNNNTSSLLRQPGGWTHKAAVAASTPTRPVEVANFGFSTQTSAQYRANFERLAQQIPATHFLIEGASVNDMGTGDSAWASSATEANLRNVMACIEIAERLYRAKCGIWGAYPRSTDGVAGTSALTVNSDGRRLSYLARLASLGYDYIDTNSLVADSQSPQSFRTVAKGYAADVSQDGIHLNDVGDTIVSVGGFQPLMVSWALKYFAA